MLSTYPCSNFKYTAMKKVILFASLLLFAAASFAKTEKPTVNEKVLKAFTETFTAAQNVLWTETENVYMVRFTNLGIRTTVKYDEDGNFVSSLRYYECDQLPVDIQCKLKKKYPNKKMFGVTEYVVGDDLNYYVKLEDDKTWTTVKIDNYRNMLITESYKKAE
jgi:uncharacterized protein YdeI (YjbR/CyaY-like superfamily)